MTGRESVKKRELEVVHSVTVGPGIDLTPFSLQNDGRLVIVSGLIREIVKKIQFVRRKSEDRELRRPSNPAQQKNLIKKWLLKLPLL